MGKSYFLILSLFLSSQSYGSDFICNLVDRPNSSELKITYDENTPTSVALRSPNEENYRTLDARVEVVFEKDSSERETFLVRPNLNYEIDWKKTPNCFVEIGTQWYFVFNHETQVYHVQLLPYFVTETPTCQTPRFQPQTQALDCVQE